MKGKIIVVFVIVMAIGFAVFSWRFFRPANPDDNRVFVSGNIEATEVDLSFRLSGQVNSVTVKEGDRVSEGQVIAQLDIDTLTALRESAQSEMHAARATLDELEEGTRPEIIEGLRAVAKAAESRLKNAQDEYDRYFPLFKEGVISSSAFDTRQTTLKVAIEDSNNAKQKLLEAEHGPREQVIRAARHRWQRAQWELKKIDLDIAHSTLSSPVSGVVLVKSVEPGEVILPGATVLTVAAIDEVWLKGYVGESDLGRVKLGQKVAVTTDTFPDKAYQGTITFISSRAEFTPKNVQTKVERVKQVYRVKVTIPNPKQELKIGMPAEGYIAVNGFNSEK
jgi:HlyD family secretion protein